MNNEFNDLNTDNTKTTFNNTPNNVEQSDELNAPPVYTIEKETHYAKSKKVSKAIIYTGVSLIFVSLAIYGVRYLTDQFVSNPPKANETSFSVGETTDSFSYSFTITNKNHYKVFFEVKRNNEDFYKIEVSDEARYEGTLESVGYNKKIDYEIWFSNRVDYTNTILKGTLTTYNPFEVR